MKFTILFFLFTVCTVCISPFPLIASQLSQDFIHFKDNAMGFNSKYDFLLEDGKVHVKKRNSTESVWMVIDEKAIFENNISFIKMSVDGSFLAAVTTNNELYHANAFKEMDAIRWSKKWGVPFGHGNGLTMLPNMKAWSCSYSDPEVHKYYVDRNGNKNTVYVRSIYTVSENGQNIHLTDPWTPADWEYQLCGPHRGRFIIQNLSVSASTMFLINKYGDMYTQQNDFDIIGANPFINYSYEEQGRYSEDKINVLKNRGLPPLPWKKQPKILDRIITDRITIISTGPGTVNRELRVEGKNRDGEIGYFKNVSEKTEVPYHEDELKIECLIIIAKL